jgi:hypothetical protein
MRARPEAYLALAFALALLWAVGVGLELAAWTPWRATP